MFVKNLIASQICAIFQCNHYIDRLPLEKPAFNGSEDKWKIALVVIDPCPVE